MEPEILVSTIVRSHDDPAKVINSVRSIFPDWIPDKNLERSDFYQESNQEKSNEPN
jgi:hypothetical protein